MFARSLLGCFLAFLITGCAATPRGAVTDTPRTTEQLITYVERAAEKLRAEGTSAFGDFAAKGGTWNQGDSYLVVLDPQGKVLFHPVLPELVGRDMRNLSDSEGRKIVLRAMDAVADPTGRGWVFYKWPRPGSVNPVWKASYVMRVAATSGEEYLIASGVYEMPVDQALVMEMVKEAAQRLQTHGRGALRAVEAKNGPLVYRDAHVFLLDSNGMIAADPLRPQLVGHPPVEIANGRPLGHELVRVALTQNAGWYEYRWPRPGSRQMIPRQVYVQQARIPGQLYIAAAGRYVE